MRRVFVEIDGQLYGVVVRDDHPAAVHPVKRSGCRETWEPAIDYIWPFHLEEQRDSIIADTVREHLARKKTD
jgi:hypothetical protein